MIGIIDYGAGNLGSVLKAFASIGVRCRVLRRPERLTELEKLVLPGVGAIGSCTDNLKANGLDEFLNEWLQDGKPYLGICLGMQILFEASSEAPQNSGLGIFKGKVLHFEQHKVPQIGWNQVRKIGWSKLLYDIPDQSFFYFLHGYYVPLLGSGIATGVTEYGIEYTSVIEKDNVCAVQFHPEKSGKTGLKLIRNWAALC